MNDAAALDLLEELVRVPSVSGDEAGASHFLVERMRSLGFDAEVDEAGNAIGRIGERGPRVVLLGHIDTVPGEVPVRRVDGKLYGRGSVDAKGPLAAFVVAAQRAFESGELACRIEIAGCVEEEVPSSKGARHFSERPAPDLCIIGEPSGWAGVTLGYKGFLRLRADFARPVRHTAGRGEGVGALACRAYVAIEEAAARFNLGREALYDQLFAHLADIRLADDGLEERARLDLRLRLPEDLGPDAAFEFVAQLLPEWSFASEGGLAAWCDRRTNPVACLLGRSISRAGGRPKFQRKTGTADLNVVGPHWRCPIAAYGPGDSALDHTPDEHVSFEEFLTGVRVLEGFLTDSALAELRQVVEV